MYPLTFTLLLSLLLETNGARVQMLGKRVTPQERAALYRRDTISGKVVGQQGFTGLQNAQDITYTMNMTIGGEQRSVLIDTGSSDLWTVGQVNRAISKNIDATITYASGEASGTIYTTDIEFAGFKVSDQAYINVTDGGNREGLIGLGPFTSSVVRTKLKGSSGDPVLNRIFAQNKTTPNFLSFTLSRNEDPTQSFLGELTVGEYVQGLENVTSQPKLPVQILPTSQQGAQHWSFLVDSIIGPDGQEIAYNTTVPDQTKAVAVVDSGFSLPQVPRSVSDALYGRVQGAEWQENTPVGATWVIPCQQELTAKFVIGGVAYDVHPLDLSLAYNAADGSTTCYGAFQPSTIKFAGASAQFDMVLGMAFLRNTYTLIDFGDFTDVNATETTDPYIQLLSLTNSAESHSDFVTVRMNGDDQTSAPQFALVPADQGLHSPTDDDGNINLSSVKSSWYNSSDKVKRILLIVGIAVGSVLILILSYCLFSACCRRNKRSGKYGFQGKELGLGQSRGGWGGQTYQQLNAPAPQSHPKDFEGHGTVNYGQIA